MAGSPLVQVVEPRLKAYVVCPHCRKRQPFVKEKEHWRTVKALHLRHPVVLRVRMIYAKCRTPTCPHKCFALPIPGIERYQRAIQSLMSKAIAGVVQDNSTLERVAQRLSRAFNTTGSKPPLDRWKHRLASEHDFLEIPSKMALSIDEYMPRRGGRYKQIAGNVLQVQIPYIEPVSWFFGRGVTEKFLRRLEKWGIRPYCVPFNLWTTLYRKVWPHVYLQYDHFHVMRRLWQHLENASIQFRKSLKGDRWTFHEKNSGR